MSAWQLTLAVACLLTTLSPSAGGDLSLTELITQVEKNERLYRNLDVFIDTHGAMAPHKEVVSDVETIDLRRRIRFAQQGEKFRLDRADESVLIDDSASAFWTILACDGSRTISRQKDGTVTVSDTPRLPNFYAHQMWVRGVAFVPPLSVWLSGDEAVTKFTGWDHHTCGYRNEIQSLGAEVIDGLMCHKVRRDRISLKTGEPAFAELLWLAEDRNYLPVRVYNYRYAWSPDVPVSQISMDEFREISPGVWFPARTTRTNYGTVTSKSFAERQWQWRETTTIASASVAPDLPVEHFSEEGVRSAVKLIPFGAVAQDPPKGPQPNTIPEPTR